MIIPPHKRTKLLRELTAVRDSLASAIHARHRTVDVTTASDHCKFSYCTECKTYFNSGQLEEIHNAIENEN